MKTQTFLGLKRIAAAAMTLGAYNTYRGWTMPANENPDAPGFLVEYIDSPGKPNHPDHAHYISWSPAEAFEQDYRTIEALPFGHVIQALNKGMMAARLEWGTAAKAPFVFRQVPSEIAADVVPRMTSLPESVRQEFIRRGEPLRYNNQLARVHPDNFIEGYSPSPADVLAEDWYVWG